jgi:hypothetical protein
VISTEPGLSAEGGDFGEGFEDLHPGLTRPRPAAGPAPEPASARHGLVLIEQLLDQANQDVERVRVVGGSWYRFDPSYR